MEHEEENRFASIIMSSSSHVMPSHSSSSSSLHTPLLPHFLPPIYHCSFLPPKFPHRSGCRLPSYLGWRAQRQRLWGARGTSGTSLATAGPTSAGERGRCTSAMTFAAARVRSHPSSNQICNKEPRKKGKQKPMRKKASIQAGSGVQAGASVSMHAPETSERPAAPDGRKNESASQKKEEGKNRR